MKTSLSVRLASLYLGLAVMALLAGCGKNLSTSAGDQSLVPGSTPEQKVTKAQAEPSAPPSAPAEPSAPPSAPAPSRENMGFGKPEAPPEARVTEPEAPPLMASPAPTEAAPSAQSVQPDRLAALAAALADIYFDYDRATIRNDGKAALEQDARLLKAENGWKLLVAGHCDERGTVAYNLVLGERRAQSVKRYLGDLGVSTAQIQVTSYGKEKPFCAEHNKDCWQKNRRAHLALQ